MTTPKREQVLERARELFYQQSYRSGMQNVNTPEDSELVESGFYSSALSSLMTSMEKKNEQRLNVDYAEPFNVNIAEAMISGVFVSGTTGAGKSDVGMYIADQLMQNNIIVIVFDSSQDWKTRSSISQYQTLKNAYINTIPEQNMIYDISMLSVLDRQRLIESFSEQLYKHQASEQNRKQYFLIFEESSNYFKEGFMRSKRLANTSTLLSEGRNYGVRFGLITQFSALIDKTCMRYMRQRYFGFTSEPRDVEYITKFFSKDKKQEIAETLRNLRSGEFVYTNSEGFSKIYIEPYTSNVVKERVFSKIPQSIKPIQQNIKTDSAILSLIKLAVLGGIVIYAIASMPK